MVPPWLWYGEGGLITSLPVAEPRKITLVPVSPQAMRRGARARNGVVEKRDGDRLFVRFEGWNYWAWVSKKNDPHYVVKRGWSDSGSTYAAMAQDVYVR